MEKLLSKYESIKEKKIKLEKKQTNLNNKINIIEAELSKLSIEEDLIKFKILSERLQKEGSSIDDLIQNSTSFQKDKFEEKKETFEEKTKLPNTNNL